MSPIGKVRCAAPQLLTGGLLLATVGLASAWPTDAPVPGPRPSRLFGVAVGLHPDATAEGLEYPPRLDEVATVGASAVLLPVPLFQADRFAVDLREGSGTPTQADLRHLIRAAHRRGLSTVLMPIVRLDAGAPEDWRGRLAPREPARWWGGYRRHLLRQAALAEEEGVAVLVIGSELTSLQADPAPWRDLAAAIREVYSGRLALVANYDGLDLTAAFDAVDIAGVSAYFPLTDDVDAPLAALEAGWARAAARLEAFRARTAKPLVVFEVGYPSIDGGATAPYDYTGGAPIDLEEQRRAYVAATRALQRLAPEGVFFWTWLGPGGRFDRHYTPRGKPAEAELRRYLRAGSAGSPARSGPRPRRAQTSP